MARELWVGLLILISLLAVLEAHSAHADDYIDMSVGMFSNGIPSPANVKLGEVGHRDSLGLGFVNDYNAGGWVQTNVRDGRKSSAFVSDQVGLEARAGIVMRIETGPAFISTPDTYLGGHFQFHETGFIGVRDITTGDEVGLTYQHFSSAGIEMPNYGRDFGGVSVSILW